MKSLTLLIVLVLLTLVPPHLPTNMHLHFRTTDGALAGHVDDLEPAGGMMLFLPVR